MDKIRYTLWLFNVANWRITMFNREIIKNIYKQAMFHGYVK